MLTNNSTYDTNLYKGETMNKSFGLSLRELRRNAGLSQRELANKIKDKMKDAGILVGVTGNFGCTVRITPPLNITKEHVDIFIKHFITTLSSL